MAFEDSKMKGRIGEPLVSGEYQLRGYKVKKTHRGSDFKMTRTSPFTGRTEAKYVEVKTGPKARLSRPQKSARKKKRKYKVERRDIPYL